MIPQGVNKQPYLEPYELLGRVSNHPIRKN